MASPETLTPNQRRALRHGRRQARLDARYTQWKITSLDRVRGCGRWSTDKEAGVTVRASGTVQDNSRTAGLSGVQTCGSVWACPVCAQKVQARRQTEVATAIAVARARGWEVLFLTLTMRHNRDHKLKQLWDHLSKAWGAINTGSGQRAWEADKRDYGIAGYVRLVEVTHGWDSGWHVHAHVLLFLDPNEAELVLARTLWGQDNGAHVHGAGFTDEEVTELGVRMFMRWRSALNVRGIRPSLERGVDIRRVRSDDKIAEYFTKQLYHLKGASSTAHDVTGSHGKEAKHGNRTPFGVLAGLVDLAATGELTDESERDLEVWHTFEKASRGRRQLLWARGLRDQLLAGTEVADDLDDQEAAELALDGETLVEISGPRWKQIADLRLIGDVLELAESDDSGELLRRWLDAGRDWYRPGGVT